MDLSKNIVLGSFILALGLAVGCGDDSGSSASSAQGGTGTSTGSASATGSVQGNAGGNGAGASGASNTNTVFAADTLPLEQFFAELSQASCRLSARCTGYLSEEDCVDENDAVMVAKHSATLAAVAEGRIIYDPVAAAAYIKAYDTIACDAHDTLETGWSDKVLIGTVDLGGDCTLHQECIGDVVCISNGTCPGQCVARHDVGGTCTSSIECATGLACTNNVCVAQLAADTTCTTADVCDRFCTCKADTTGTMSCQPVVANTYLRELGQSCQLDGVGLCVAGLVCQTGSADTTVTGTCVPKVATGASCTYAIPNPCAVGSYCQITTGASTGTCVQLPTVGQACGSQVGTSYTRCASDSVCINDVCIVLRANGETCTLDEDCASAYCDNGSCAQRLDCE